MSEIEKVVTHTSRLERLLREQYYAKGQGLVELTESCGTRLPHDIAKKLYSIADIRQSLLDDEESDPTLVEQFVQACKECEKELTPRSGRLVWGAAIVFMLLMTLGAMVLYFVHWDVVSQHLNLN